jgi:hypothetical protein
MSEPNLAALLETLLPKRGVRVVQLGRGSAGVQKQLAPLFAAYGAEIVTIEDGAPEAGSAAQYGDPFNIALPGGVGLCVVTLSLARIPDVFEELINDQLATVVEEGGVVLAMFCRDASDAGLDALRITQPHTRAALRDFVRDQFGRERIDDPEILRKRFAKDGVYEFMGWASRTGRPVAGEPLVWVALCRRDAERTEQAFTRTDRADRFPLRDLRTFVETLRGANVPLLPIDAFAQRLKAPDDSGFGLIKLDLHRQIRRPLEVARLLTRQNVPGLFLMMPLHPFNEAFFDAPHTWDILRAIADGGHEIGLHLDVFHLIRAHGDLYEGVGTAVEDFHKHGFAIRAATLHGDTRKHILERGLVREDFFEEDAALSKWDGQPPEGEAELVNHIRRYSYRELAARCGIKYLVEERFRHNGVLVSDAPLTYVTDNNRSLEARNLPASAGTTRLVAPQPFRIDERFARSVAGAVRTQPFLALFHPQWFW